MTATRIIPLTLLLFCMSAPAAAADTIAPDPYAAFRARHHDLGAEFTWRVMDWAVDAAIAKAPTADALEVLLQREFKVSAAVAASWVPVEGLRDRFDENNNSSTKNPDAIRSVLAAYQALLVESGGNAAVYKRLLGYLSDYWSELRASERRHFFDEATAVFSGRGKLPPEVFAPPIARLHDTLKLWLQVARLAGSNATVEALNDFGNLTNRVNPLLSAAVWALAGAQFERESPPGEVDTEAAGRVYGTQLRDEDEACTPPSRAELAYGFHADRIGSLLAGGLHRLALREYAEWSAADQARLLRPPDDYHYDPEGWDLRLGIAAAFLLTGEAAKAREILPKLDRYPPQTSSNIMDDYQLWRLLDALSRPLATEDLFSRFIDFSAYRHGHPDITRLLLGALLAEKLGSGASARELRAAAAARGRAFRNDPVVGAVTLPAEIAREYHRLTLAPAIADESPDSRAAAVISTDTVQPLFARHSLPANIASSSDHSTASPHNFALDDEWLPGNCSPSPRPDRQTDPRRPPALPEGFTPVREEDVEGGRIALFWNPGGYWIARWRSGEFIWDRPQILDLPLSDAESPAEHSELPLLAEGQLRVELVHSPRAGGALTEAVCARGCFAEWSLAALMTDMDGDGVSDLTERRYFFTNPQSADSDGDGLADGVDPSPRLDFRQRPGPAQEAVAAALRADMDESPDRRRGPVPEEYQRPYGDWLSLAQKTPGAPARGKSGEPAKPGEPLRLIARPENLSGFAWPGPVILMTPEEEAVTAVNAPGHPLIRVGAVVFDAAGDFAVVEISRGGRGIAYFLLRAAGRWQARPLFGFSESDPDQ